MVRSLGSLGLELIAGRERASRAFDIYSKIAAGLDPRDQFIWFSRNFRLELVHMAKDESLRIAMWSGPRNISTAMMRSFGNRPDTAVIDEPFYAFYLQATGRPHPGAAEVVAQGETDWQKVVARLTGEVPDGKRVFYQKQMTHHLLAEIDRGWLDKVTNCFLIRDPAEVIASYLRKNDEPSLEDIGFAQQAEIFDWVQAHTGVRPPVVDAHDVLENPERTLRLLCGALGLSFTDAMLSWAPGLRDTDGIWAKHWYREVADSTGFRKPGARGAAVPERLRGVCDRAREYYERLHVYRLK